LRVWCGVIFLSSFCAAWGCSDNPASSRQGPLVLAIGVPESGANGRELGIGSLISNSTLEGLTQVNASTDGRALPRLAESWTWEDNGRRLRLKLREGVVFHDGTPLTAAVAGDSLRVAIADPGNRSLYPSLADITAIRPDGTHGLLIELSEPSAFLPEELDLPLAVGPANAGTGPFRLVRREGSSAVLERFDQYYLGAPAIEQIVIRPFDTLRTAWTNLLRGEVDMVTDVPPDAVEFVSNGDIQVFPFARSYQFLIGFNSRRGAFRSPVVRRALNLAVDREALIANVLQGQGQAAAGPLWPQHWAYDRSASGYAFEPEYATTLLSDSGFDVIHASNGDRPPARFRFTCLLPANFSVLERIGLEVQKQLFDIGVDMQFEVVSLTEYDLRLREGRFDAVLVDLISGPTFGRPFIFWRSGDSFKGLNVFGYENPEAERLFNVLRTAQSEAAIRSATPRLQRILVEDPPALFLAWNARARAVRSQFNVTIEPGRDPLLTIRQWTENPDAPSAGAQ
jgi:peptide/nickel transport system substrate-binding protein